MEAEIIPMCQDQGLAIVSWASLGGGALSTAKQREAVKNDSKNRSQNWDTPNSIKVSEVLEKLAQKHDTTLQATVSGDVVLRHCSKLLTLSSGPCILDVAVSLRRSNRWCPDCGSCPRDAGSVECSSDRR